MGRPKHFTREEVLEKAIPVFWEHGFADTGLQALEKATGVNKSGLYAEFKSKKELFLASLRHYLDNRGGKALLSAEPLGWDNVENLLKLAVVCADRQKGCFAISSMREFAILPAEAHKIVAERNAKLKRLLEDNIRVEKTKADPAAIAELVSTFFCGLCVEQNLKAEKTCSERKIENLMKMLRSL